LLSTKALERWFKGFSLPLRSIYMIQEYCVSLTKYQRLPVREVRVGDLTIGHLHPVRIQTMTTTDTMDTAATVAQTIRCIKAGAELVRITAPSKNEAENLLNIKNELRRKGYNTPLVADIHFTPNAAEVAARIVEKVRINPGNYFDKKKFDVLSYTDAEYAAEIDRIRERMRPLIDVCKQYGTAMRIGTNHGSLSDRIMSRYGDTPMGMVESAMEFLRIARDERYHNIVLSMKSSNPLVMVQAYRLLVHQMDSEFGECYPLHLGVTEAGDGEDGRIKSAVGIGTLMEDGIGDTIRVSLTEDPEFEIPVCRDMVNRYVKRAGHAPVADFQKQDRIPYSPFQYERRPTEQLLNIGGQQVPVVVADYSGNQLITPGSLEAIGYQYDEASDKWRIGDAAADYLFIGDQSIGFSLPGTLRIICNWPKWIALGQPKDVIPLCDVKTIIDQSLPSGTVRFVEIPADELDSRLMGKLKSDADIIPVIKSQNEHAMPEIRRWVAALMSLGIQQPVIIKAHSSLTTVDEQLIDLSAVAGGLLLEGMGNGLWFTNNDSELRNNKMTGRTYIPINDNKAFLNNTAFTILQATRTRISKTEYISCPSCGRTLFDLQETTAQIKSATQHLKGVKIAIMGCIVNGPGEMADADFGYVGSGPGKITLYKGKEIIKKNIPRETALTELINLLRSDGAWIEA